MNKNRSTIILLLILCLLPIGGAAQGMRGITLEKFVPKGQWIVGSNISFSQSKQENYNFIVIESVSGDGYTFKVSPVLAYAFKDNLAAGGRLGYKRSLVKVDNFNVEAGDDISFDINNIYSLSHEFSAVAIMRNYISIGNSKRFALFSEAQLKFAGGQSKYVDHNGNELTGTYSTNFSTGLGIAPGLVAFINNYTAVEVNVGVMGINYSHKHQVTDQIYEANQSTTSLNFRVNIFSIGLGIAFYI